MLYVNRRYAIQQCDAKVADFICNNKKKGVYLQKINKKHRRLYGNTI